MFPSPCPRATGHLAGWLEPVLSLLAPPARLPCLVLGALQHPRRQGAGCLHSGESWCDPKPLPCFPQGRSGVWVKPDPTAASFAWVWCSGSVGVGCPEPSPSMTPAPGGISQPICGARAWGARRQRQEAGRSCGLGWDGGFSAGSCHLEAISRAGGREPPSRGHTRRPAPRGHSRPARSLPRPPGGPQLPSARRGTGQCVWDQGAAAGLLFGQCIPQSFGHGAGGTRPPASVIPSTAAIIPSVLPSLWWLGTITAKQRGVQ